MTDLFILIGGVLSFVIGMIGILNFINTILTSIISRQKEFAMMEAIGMTKRQLTRMLILEGLYYAAITIAAAFTLGVSRDIDPFMTLSFMALPVIPTLRITTQGVFDVGSQSYV